MKYVDESGIETVVEQLKEYADGLSKTVLVPAYSEPELAPGPNGEESDESEWGRRAVKAVDDEEASEIGEYAFYMNTALERVNLPAVYIMNGEKAFYGCTALTDVNFATDECVFCLEEYTFGNCTSLETAHVNPFTTSSHAFDGSHLTTLHLDYTVAFDWYAFSNMPFLEHLYLKDTGNYASSGMFARLDMAGDEDDEFGMDSIGETLFACYEDDPTVSTSYPNVILHVPTGYSELLPEEWADVVGIAGIAEDDPEDM